MILKKYLQRLAILDQLQLPKDQYLIWGSGPLAIRGLRGARDIDLVVTSALWIQLCKNYETSGPKSNKIAIGEVDIWSDLLNLTHKIDQVIADRDMIEGYPFMKLSYTLAWKKYWNSQKDPKDIELIEKYLYDQRCNARVMSYE